MRLGNRTYRPGKNVKLPKYLFNPHEVCGTNKRHKLEVYATRMAQPGKFAVQKSPINYRFHYIRTEQFNLTYNITFDIILMLLKHTEYAMIN